MGQNDYIEYRTGNMPIVLSIPHGGSLTPSEIPDRLCPDCVTVNDAFTIELGTALSDSIHAITGCRPHVIINHLDRIKLDANRNLADAALGHPIAEQAWNDFHGFIEDAKTCVEEQFGTGLYIDLHGHGHTIERIEYGYLIYEDELAFDESVLNSTTYVNYSSLRNLVAFNVMGLQHTDLLKGDFALGSLLHAQGYPGVPSSAAPYPLPGEPYFSGGYNTAVHSSYNGGTIDGVQIECNQALRFDPEARDIFAGALAENIVQFVEYHYGHSSSTCAVSISEHEDSNVAMIHPNPGYTQFQIAPAMLKNLERLSIFDSQGRLQQQIPPETEYIHIERPGVYMVVLRLKDGREYSERIISLH